MLSAHSLNDLLLASVGLSSALSAAFTARTRREGLFGRHLLLLAATVVLYLVDRPRGGYWVAIAFVLAVVVPIVARLRFAGLARAGRFEGSARWAGILAWLLPGHGYGAIETFHRAFAALTAGDFPTGEARLTEVAAGPPPLAAIARGELLAARGEWSRLRDEALTKTGVDALVLTPRLLRAHGELGDLGALFRDLEARDGALATMAAERRLGWLAALAFGGRPSAVQALLAGPLQHLSGPVGGLWLGTAHLAAGDEAAGLAALEAARAGGDALVRRSVQRRLAAPPVVAEAVLDGPMNRLLNTLEQRAAEEMSLSRVRRELPRPRAVFGLAILLVSVFVVEVVAGGSTSPEVLLDLGALEVDRVLAGELGRIFAAQFLHMGPIHLGVNLLSLAILGIITERLFGVVRFLLVYLGAGTAAMTAMVVLVATGTTPPHLLVGASGNIMGLAGAGAAALLVRGAGGLPDTLRRRQFLVLGALVLAQAVMDLVVAGTSFGAHGFGAAFGFILGGVVAGAPRWRVALLGGALLTLAIGGEAAAGQLGLRGGDLPERYRQGCDAGVAAACNNLGVHIEVPPDGSEPSEADYREAAALFRRACELGSATGCHNFAIEQRHGVGVPRDEAGARRTLDRACRLDPEHCGRR